MFCNIIVMLIITRDRRQSWPRTLLEMKGKIARDLHGIISYLDTLHIFIL